MTVPVAVNELVIMGTLGLIVMLTVAAGLVSVEFVAVTVTFVVPAVVGVPEMTPVVALRVNPAGRFAAV